MIITQNIGVLEGEQRVTEQTIEKIKAQAAQLEAK